MAKCWKDIRGYEGLYQISDLGQIRSFHKWHGCSFRILKPNPKNGYPFIFLSKNHQKKGYYVHRLVLETFKESCPIGKECLHNDGNRRNTKLNNLRWGTRSQNIFDSIGHKTWCHLTPPRGIKHGHAKLTNQDVRRIRHIYATGQITQLQLAQQFNVTSYTISDIVHKRTWKHI